MTLKCRVPDYGDSQMKASRRFIGMLALVGLVTVPLSGCIGIAAGAAAGAASVGLDRRSVGAQTDDESIELKARSRIREQQGTPEEVSVTSYNRKVLLTGQVPDEAGKKRAEQIVSSVENVRTVNNEIQIGPIDTVSGLNDSLVTTKVKAAFVGEKSLQSNAVKVVTENGTVYLMGLVTKAEGDLAAQAAAKVTGVKRVVTVFEYISDEELKRIQSVTGKAS